MLSVLNILANNLFGYIYR